MQRFEDARRVKSKFWIVQWIADNRDSRQQRLIPNGHILVLQDGIKWNTDKLHFQVDSLVISKKTLERDRAEYEYLRLAEEHGIPHGKNQRIRYLDEGDIRREIIRFVMAASPLSKTEHDEEKIKIAYRNKPHESDRVNVKSLSMLRVMLEEYGIDINWSYHITPSQFELYEKGQFVWYDSKNHAMDSEIAQVQPTMREQMLEDRQFRNRQRERRLNALHLRWCPRMRTNNIPTNDVLAMCTPIYANAMEVETSDDEDRNLFSRSNLLPVTSTPRDPATPQADLPGLSPASPPPPLPSMGQYADILFDTPAVPFYVNSQNVTVRNKRRINSTLPIDIPTQEQRTAREHLSDTLRKAFNCVNK